jgi:hypothetical protein
MATEQSQKNTQDHQLAMDKPHPSSMGLEAAATSPSTIDYGGEQQGGGTKSDGKNQEGEPTADDGSFVEKCRELFEPYGGQMEARRTRKAQAVAEDKGYLRQDRHV